jgi:glycosyltransferase involved in cell wall biosynthesis
MLTSAALDLSVLVTTFERPRNLERSLASLAVQRGVAGRFEVVVTDDGSRDGTHGIVRDFARRAPFPVRLTTHEHDGFRVALCRNDGVRASAGSYLLFCDGDCILPPRHLERHLRARRPGVVRVGKCLRLDRAATERLTVKDVESGAYRRLVPLSERWRVWRRWARDLECEWRRHPLRPKIAGYDFAIAREDFEAVNGFDEEYVGWGCEDDDFAARLRMAGRRIRTIAGSTRAYHMWHPGDPSRPATWSEGANVARFLHGQREIRCKKGLADLSASRAAGRGP